MLDIVVRGLLVAGGAITSWFVAHDALNYEIVRMAAAILIFVLMVALATFWRTIWDWVTRLFGRQQPKP